MGGGGGASTTYRAWGSRRGWRGTWSSSNQVLVLQIEAAVEGIDKYSD